MAEQWTTLAVGVPQPLQDLTQALDSLIDALLTILDLAVAALDIIKAFMVGLIDPIQAIIQAIIQEIEALIQDIRQIGIYIAGDIDDYPMDRLLGGYTAYERRMVARLVDRTDPTRPNFSANSEVIAIFLYASVDVTDLQAAVAFIERIRAFFGIRRSPRAFPQPSGLQVSYGAEGTSVALFGELSDVFRQANGDPTIANVKWAMAPAANSGSVAWPLPAPPGFLVEVSTIQDGLVLAWEAPATPAAPDLSAQQDRIFGLVTDPDGRPFRLYGGTDMLNTSDLAWTGGGGTYSSPAIGADGNLKGGGIRLMAFKDSTDNVPIPLDALHPDADTYLLQRTFFLDIKTILGVNPIQPGQPFSVNLKYSDMPFDATFTDGGDGKVLVAVDPEPARIVYVRISAVTSKFTGTGSPARPSIAYWNIAQWAVTAGARSGPVRLYFSTLSGADKGENSQPLTVTFPTAAGDYLNAVTAALAILVLARADLVPHTDATTFNVDVGGTVTGLEDLGRYLVARVLGPFPSKFFKKADVRPAEFRKRLLKRCRGLANDLFALTGPLPASVETLVVDSSKIGGVPLGDLTWASLVGTVGIFSSDVTILDSLDGSTTSGRDPTRGVGLNPISIGLNSEMVKNLLIGGGIELDRTPGFLVSPNATGMLGEGSADFSPVIYAQTASGATAGMVFCRNVFLANPTVLAAAALVLNVASAPLAISRPPGAGAWTAYRLFPQGLPPLDALLNEIIGFLNAVSEGIKAITDLIVQYIDFVEARILDLEALLRRIEGLLDAMLNVVVPQAAGLIVTGAGTDAILEGLVTSGNKPMDGTTSYGMGLVLLAGGLPTAVVELLQLFFPAG